MSTERDKSNKRSCRSKQLAKDIRGKDALVPPK